MFRCFLILAPLLMLISSPVTAGTQKGVTMVLKSPAFSEGKEIPKEYTGEGADLSPALEWTGAPAGTKELALVCDDPDAPTSEPWVHWVVYKIPGSTTQLPKGVPAKSSSVVQGKNSWGSVGYRGPLPPPGHGWHRYYFKLYALDSALSLKPGAAKSELMTTLKGHILAEAALMGKYQRK